MDATDRFKVLAAAALMDGSVGPQEHETLLKAARELGVIPSMAEQILAETKKDGKLAARIPTDPKQRTVLFRSLVDVIAADGEVDDKELALFRRLGPAFGINELEVEDLLRSAAAAKREAAKRKR